MSEGDHRLSPADQLKEAVWRQIVQLARADEGFRRRLQADPVAVLAAAELDAPPDIKFVFIETDHSDVEDIAARSSGSIVYVPIRHEEQNELGEDELAQVVGGSGERPEPALAIPAMPPSFATSISLSGDGPALDLNGSGTRPRPR